MNERTIFLQALEKRDPAERSSFLSEACGGDTALRQRVEQLLHSHTEAGSFLNIPIAEQENVHEATPSGVSETRTVNEDAAGSEFGLDFLAPSERPDSLGRLDHYEVLEVVGRGGMGVVLRAFDEKLHRIVALKVMARDIASSAPGRKRFSREAKAAAAVVHDHIVPIHAIEESGPLPYLVMQYIDGKSLQQKIDEEGSLELKEVLRIATQIASGLAAAHKQGLVHRDIKPSNILLENGVQRVKITDFGLARAVDDATVSQTGIVAGTPQYMSPEQADGKPVDHRSDLFSLGSVMYAMCTGRPPFRAASTVATLKRVCEDTPRPITELNPDIPPWLCELIAKLHAKSPAERFQNAKEAAEVLEGHLAQVQQSSGAIASRQKVTANLAEKRLVLAPALKSLRIPAIGLGITGIAYWATIPILFIAAFSGRVTDQVFEFLWLRLGLIPAIAGSLLIFAAWKMRRAELYWLCLLAACLPFVLLAEKLITIQQQRLTMAFGDITALPFGMWALIVLTRSDVRAAFARQQDVVEPTSMPAGRRRWKVKLALLALIGILAIYGVSQGQAIYRRATGKARLFVVLHQSDARVFVKKDDRNVMEFDGGQSARYAMNLESGSYEVTAECPPGYRARWTLTRDQRVFNPFGSPRTYLTLGGALQLQSRPGEEYSIHLWADPISKDEQDSGWVPLFNCNDLSGWKPYPSLPGKWRVEDGCIVGTGPDSYLFSENEYEDFHLRFKKKSWGRGSFSTSVRMPYAVQPDPRGGYLFAGGGVQAQIAVADSGLWHDCEIIARGESIQTKVNGKTILHRRVAKRKRGSFALHIWAEEGRPALVHFKDIQIKELPPEEPGWVRLFNGEDLKGWLGDPRPWAVDGDAMTASGPDAYLRTQRQDFKNFIVRFDFEVESSDASAPELTVQLHGIPLGDSDPNRRHAIIQFAADGKGAYGLTGSKALKEESFKKFTGSAFKTLNTIEVQSIHGDIAVTFNGASVTQFSGRELQAGYIGLQAKNGRWKFRNIEVKELPPEHSPAVAPFDAAKAKEHQDAWAKHLGAPVEIENSIGMKLRLIPPGEFTIGSTFEEVESFVREAAVNAHAWIRSEAPERKVRIDRPYYLAACETTVGHFKQFVKETGYQTEAEASGKGGFDGERKPEYTWRHKLVSVSDEHPVGFLSLKDAQEFCRWLSKKEGRQYVVPTEEQWEFACRAGTTTPWFCTKDELARFAWVDEYTAKEVGRKAANPFGLFDMYGNMEELTLGEKSYVARSGAGAAVRMRSASRVPQQRAESYRSHGFRVAIVGDLKVNALAEADPMPHVRPLDGRWLAVAAEYQGKPVPLAAMKEQFPSQMLIKGEQYGITWAGKQHEGRLRVDATKDPAEIDFSGSVFAGLSPRKAIYELNGDQLKLCLPFVGPKSDPPRPTNFTTDAQSRNAVLTYRREKSPDPRLSADGVRIVKRFGVSDWPLDRQRVVWSGTELRIELPPKSVVQLLRVDKPGPVEGAEFVFRGKLKTSDFTNQNDLCIGGDWVDESGNRTGSGDVNIFPSTDWKPWLVNPNTTKGDRPVVVDLHLQNQTDKAGTVWIKDVELVEIVRLTAPAAVAPADPVRPFTVFLKEGGGVKSYPTLGEAIGNASDGAIIEIKGNGPFTLLPIDLRNKSAKALTIRAASGYRPVIVRDMRENPSGDLFQIERPLVLEGIEIVMPPRETGGVNGIIKSHGAGIYAANCRFRMGYGHCIESWGQQNIDLQNCEFLCGGVAVECLPQPGSRITIANCILTGNVALGFTLWPAKDNPITSDLCQVEFHRNTVRTKAALNFQFGQGKLQIAAGTSPLVAIKANGNSFDVDYMLRSTGDPKDLPSTADSTDKTKGYEFYTYFGRILSWKGDRNAYKGVHPFRLAFAEGPLEWTHWASRWGKDETKFLSSEFHYKGDAGAGKLAAKLKDTPEDVTPDDFRPAAGSASAGAADDPKLRGAEVDLVGPTAYARWAASAEHREWRKRAGAAAGEKP